MMLSMSVISSTVQGKNRGMGGRVEGTRCVRRSKRQSMDRRQPIAVRFVIGEDGVGVTYMDMHELSAQHLRTVCISVAFLES